MYVTLVWSFKSAWVIQRALLYFARKEIEVLEIFFGLAPLVCMRLSHFHHCFMCIFLRCAASQTARNNIVCHHCEAAQLRSVHTFKPLFLIDCKLLLSLLVLIIKLLSAVTVITLELCPQLCCWVLEFKWA